MKAVKETFKALETIAQATEQSQEIKFYFNGSEFTFRVNYYPKDEQNEAFTLSSVERWADSWNVDKITDKALTLFTYTMFGKKITERLPMEQITLTK